MSLELDGLETNTTLLHRQVTSITMHSSGIRFPHIIASKRSNMSLGFSENWEQLHDMRTLAYV